MGTDRWVLIGLATLGVAVICAAAGIGSNDRIADQRRVAELSAAWKRGDYRPVRTYFRVRELIVGVILLGIALGLLAWARWVIQTGGES